MHTKKLPSPSLKKDAVGTQHKSDVLVFMGRRTAKRLDDEQLGRMCQVISELEDPSAQYLYTAAVWSQVMDSLVCMPTKAITPETFCSGTLRRLRLWITFVDGYDWKILARGMGGGDSFLVWDIVRGTTLQARRNAVAHERQRDLQAAGSHGAHENMELGEPRGGERVC
jgi:hypothetical protein